MSQLGLRSVSNPSEIFLSAEYSESEFLAGLAVAVVLDGSRTFLLEIQVFPQISCTYHFLGTRMTFLFYVKCIFKFTDCCQGECFMLYLIFLYFSSILRNLI